MMVECQDPALCELGDECAEFRERHNGIAPCERDAAVCRENLLLASSAPAFAVRIRILHECKVCLGPVWGKDGEMRVQWICDDCARAFAGCGHAKPRVEG
jgi:hypothetical protein